MQPISYARHQFPPEVIWHAVRLYLRFTLSYRDVEELLAERGVDIYGIDLDKGLQLRLALLNAGETGLDEIDGREPPRLDDGRKLADGEESRVALRHDAPCGRRLSEIALREIP
jgi:hypothetical protein